jgi:uncharacterized protein
MSGNSKIALVGPDGNPLRKALYRDPAEIRRNGNRLADSPSLYLRQHAHNPVDWYPWGEEALNRATDEQRPIFLSIGYSSCHWCHVMENEVFENDTIAAYLNEHYICIKVDREERPDLDAAYMEAVLSLTGSGGWPMSVFLAPSLAPFFAGTYFPPDYFSMLIERIVDTFANRRADVETQIELLRQRLVQQLPQEKGDVPDDNTLDRAAAGILQLYDRKYGGIGTTMKFPMPPLWSYLLRRYRKTGRADLAAAVRGTLDNMASGGIHDHLAGGFFRYAVEQTWTVPHFEKMLYDNAGLASLYLEAAVVFDDKRYREIARTTLDFMIEQFSGDEGGFYSSFDADSEGGEGAFYVWTPDEIIEVAGEADGPALAYLLGATVEGNFEGKTNPTRRTTVEQTAQNFDLSVEQAVGLFDKWRQPLLQKRAERRGPGLDRKIITSWNGLAISALARGYMLFGYEPYREAAERAANFLRDYHRRPDGGLYRNSNDGRAANDGILDDYAFLAQGLIDLYQATGEGAWFAKAIELIDYAEDNFSAGTGGYYLSAVSTDAPLGRKIEKHDGVLPSGNAIMLQVLIKAGTIAGLEKYIARTQDILESNADEIRAAAGEMPAWLEAAQMINGPFYDVVVARGNNAEKSAEMLFELRSKLAASAVIVEKPATADELSAGMLAQVTADKQAEGENPVAYVCRRGSCQAPQKETEPAVKEMLDGWHV